MKFRSVQPLANVFRDIRLNLGVVSWGIPINADETRPGENPHIAENPVVLSLLGKGIESAANGVRRNGLWKTVKRSDPWVACLLGNTGARLFDGLLNASCTN